jgi:hypothetical protein
MTDIKNDFGSFEKTVEDSFTDQNIESVTLS